jgi:DNA polymerase I-like protein with 3'-5' exonuclease and polymerase domains
LITGEGLSGILLLTQDTADQKGFLLDRLIRRSGFKKEDFFFAVAENGWFSDAVAKGVKVVMPLGEKALRRATGNSDIRRWRGRVIDNSDWPFFILPTFNPKYLLPRKQKKPRFPGDVVERDGEIMPKPARYQGRFARDLQVAKHIALHGFRRTEVHYLLDPSPEVFGQWVDEYLAELERNPETRLAFDMETPYKKDVEDEEEQEEKEKFNSRNLDIIRWSFTFKFAHAVTIPNLGIYRRHIERALSTTGDKVTTNGRDFDYKVAKHNAYTIRGRHFDTFDLMKWWQSDLDKGLEVSTADTTDLLPWKHLSDARPDFYAATDADASWRVADYIIRKIKEQGAWEVFLETFTDLMPYMVEAGDRGNAIDLGYQETLKVEFGAEIDRLDAEIQKVVPQHLKPTHRYKRQPFPDEALTEAAPTKVEWEGRTFLQVWEKNEVKVCGNCGKWPVTKGEHTAKKSLGKVLVSELHHKKCAMGTAGLDGISFNGQPVEWDACTCKQVAKSGWPKRKWDVTPNPCHAAEIKTEIHPTIEWDEVLPFNVGSSPQLIAYMKAHKHPVAKNPDDPDRDSADAQHLEMLARTYKEKHPVYGLAGDFKKVDKARSTYLWIPGPDGFVHQTYVNSPNTLRFGGRAYNLMNVGKREKNPWTVKARNQIVARPGHVFVNADSKSIEGVMQGWYMGDEHFMWLANQSSHAWLAAQYLGWDFNPETIEKIKKEKKSLYDGMKVMNYTISFGGSAYGAFMSNRDVFPTLQRAEEIEAIIFKLLPTLEAYQYQQRYLAQKQGYIESPWKWRGYFYDVFTYKRDKFGGIEYTLSGRPKLKLSKDGKRVVAVLPQHSNAMFARQNLLRIGRSEWGIYMPANVFVHDGYLLEVPEKRAEEAEDFLLNLLTRPIPEMGGLRVGAESEIGYNWGDFHMHGPTCKPDCAVMENPRGMKGSRKMLIEKQELSFMPKSSVVPDEMMRAA